MTIINITEIQNKNMPQFQVIKENQDIYIYLELMQIIYLKEMV